MNNTPLIRIACADDHPMIRQGLVSFVNRFGGMQVDIEAANGKELLEQIEKCKYPPDICMLDVSMPVMNGFETLLELKRRWPEIKVLVFTIHEMDMIVVRMIKNGVNGYLPKRCPPEELKNALQAIHSDGMYYNDIATRKYFQAIRSGNVNIPLLTPMEMQVISYSHTNLTYAQIAEKIGVTTKSVEGHRDSIFKKLGINSRNSLTLFAMENGLIDADTGRPTCKNFFAK